MTATTHSEGKHLGPAQYVMVWAALMVLTGVTLAVWKTDLSYTGARGGGAHHRHRQGGAGGRLLHAPLGGAGDRPAGAGGVGALRGAAHRAHHGRQRDPLPLRQPALLRVLEGRRLPEGRAAHAGRAGAGAGLAPATRQEHPRGHKPSGAPPRRPAARTRPGRRPRSSTARSARAQGGAPARPGPRRGRCGWPARAGSRRSRWRWPGRRSTGPRPRPPGRWPAGSSSPAASSSPRRRRARPARRRAPPSERAAGARPSGGRRRWGSRPAPRTRRRVRARPRRGWRRRPRRREASASLAAFTMASTSSRVMSPWTIWSRSSGSGHGADHAPRLAAGPAKGGDGAGSDERRNPSALLVIGPRAVRPDGSRSSRFATVARSRRFAPEIEAVRELQIAAPGGGRTSPHSRCRHGAAWRAGRHRCARRGSRSWRPPRPRTPSRSCAPRRSRESCARPGPAAGAARR